jgi:energy-coupling factor transporter ATP-binding protein EcfA2
MAHIVKFAIEGLAGRESVYARTLNRGVNVFFGLNGSGKTSLLRILDSAMSGDTDSLINVPFKKAAVTIFTLSLDRELEYTIDRADFQPVRPPQLEFSAEMASVLSAEYRARLLQQTRPAAAWHIEPPLDKPTKWAHRFLPATRLLYPPDSEPSERLTSAEGIDLQFERTLQRHWSDFFGKIQASVRQSQQKGLADILNAVLNVDTLGAEDHDLDASAAYDQIVTFLRRQDAKAAIPLKESFTTRFHQNALLRNVVARIDRVERDITAAMAPRTQLDSLISRLFSGNKTVRFGATSIEVVTADRTNIGLRSLSSGEKHILRILFEAILAGESTLMIDEPEMSLHLDWQRGLIHAIQELNQDCQLIFATHSPEIMADIDETKIFEL